MDNNTHLLRTRRPHREPHLSQPSADDIITNYMQAQAEAAKPLGLTLAVPINFNTAPQEYIAALWDKVKTANYAVEDPYRGDQQAFLLGLIQSNTYAFEIQGSCYAVLKGAAPGLNCEIHFITFERAKTQTVVSAGREIFDFAFKQIGVSRITGLIPSFNQQAIRFATLLHMKFEGELRRAFLYEGERYGLHLYGVLQNEWLRRS